MLIKLPGMDMFIPILEIRKWSSEKLRDLARVTQLKKKKKKQTKKQKQKTDNGTKRNQSSLER